MITSTYNKLIILITVIVTLSLVTFNKVQAQDEGGLPFDLSGSVDTYFRSNINSTNDVTTGGTVAPGTSFANNPGFAFGMINLVASYETGKTGFVGDLVFGPRGDAAVFGSVDPSGDPSNEAIVNQLYVYHNVTDAVTLTLGNFNTFLGYEVISPTANFNYSTSYMFSFGPFSHTGFKADFDLGGGFTAMGAIMNPTDITEFNPTAEYVGGFQLGYSNDTGGAWLNTLFDDDFFQIDLTTGWDLTDVLYGGLNATYADDSFYGVAGYFQVATSDVLSLGTRIDFFGDEGVGVIGEDETVVDLTFSANIKQGNLTIIPEFRVDLTSNEPFLDGDLQPQGTLSSFLIAAVYSF